MEGEGEGDGEGKVKVNGKEEKEEEGTQVGNSELSDGGKMFIRRSDQGELPSLDASPGV